MRRTERPAQQLRCELELTEQCPERRCLLQAESRGERERGATRDAAFLGAFLSRFFYVKYYSTFTFKRNSGCTPEFVPTGRLKKQFACGMSNMNR